MAKVIAWLIVGAFVALGAWIATTRYQECRAHGFSLFFCVGQ